MARRKRVPGLTFSWKRALGISKAKRRVSRKTRIPLSKSGRRMKAGRMMGCMLPITMVFMVIILLLFLFL